MSTSLVQCTPHLLPMPVTAAPLQCPFTWEPLTMTDVLLALLLLVPR